MGEKDKKQTNPSTTSGGPPPRQSQGGASGRKPPRWTIAFLRALERTGEVEAAARDAGIDKTTAYGRRKAHADFAESWEEALRRHSGRTEEEVRERVGFWERVKGKVIPKLLQEGQSFDRLRTNGFPSSLDRLGTNGTGEHGREARPTPQPSPACGRGGHGEGRAKEELLATTALGGKMVRPGPGKWNASAEKRFFDELAGSANVKRAAAAAGVSTNAVYARRMKRPDFRAKWDAVLDVGRSAIEMHLVEAAKKSFDPDELDVEGAEPKVSVAEAIRIVQLHGNKAQKQGVEQAEPSEDEVAKIRQRLLKKLARLRERMMPEMLAQGWSYDEAHDHMVPPGWVRGADVEGTGRHEVNS